MVLESPEHHLGDLLRCIQLNEVKGLRTRNEKVLVFHGNVNSVAKISECDPHGSHEYPNFCFLAWPTYISLPLCQLGERVNARDTFYFIFTQISSTFIIGQ